MNSYALQWRFDQRASQLRVRRHCVMSHAADACAGGVPLCTMLQHIRPVHLFAVSHQQPTSFPGQQRLCKPDSLTTGAASCLLLQRHPIRMICTAAQLIFASAHRVAPWLQQPRGAQPAVTTRSAPASHVGRAPAPVAVWPRQPAAPAAPAPLLQQHAAGAPTALLADAQHRQLRRRQNQPMMPPPQLTA